MQGANTVPHDSVAPKAVRTKTRYVDSRDRAAFGVKILDLRKKVFEVLEGGLELMTIPIPLSHSDVPTQQRMVNGKVLNQGTVNTVFQPMTKNGARNVHFRTTYQPRFCRFEDSLVRFFSAVQGLAFPRSDAETVNTGRNDRSGWKKDGQHPNPSNRIHTSLDHDEECVAPARHPRKPAVFGFRDSSAPLTA